MSDSSKASQDLLNKLAKDPDYIKKALRSQEMSAFKNEFGVERASPLRCPACNQYGHTGGSLWGPREGAENEFVCRKCREVFVVECKTTPQEALFIFIKENYK